VTICVTLLDDRMLEQHFVGLLSLGILESNELLSWQPDLERSPTARQTCCS
jgi:hypothetical protein